MAKTFKGTAGRDYFDGTSGDDICYGYDGDDHFWHSAGNDVFNGGNGIDTVNYTGATGGVSVWLWKGYGEDDAKAKDNYISIENVHGSNWNDLLEGDNNDNELDGHLGRDTLRGFAGNDKLYADEADYLVD